MNTVTDKIGEEYKDNWDRFKKNYEWFTYENDEWFRDYDDEKEEEQYEEYKEYKNYCYKDGNCIFISAPTGSGKTYFILNIWLKYLAGKQKKMLYLVNRSILKRDIEKKIHDMHSTYSRFVEVKLYQEIEAELKAEEYIQRKNDNEDSEEQEKVGDKAYIYKDMRMKYVDYYCVVCDECHYFLADSNFNTDTSLSFRMIQDCFAHKIRIFMSATINEIKTYIRAYDYKREYNERDDKYYFADIESKEWEKERVEQKVFGHYPCQYFDDYVIDKNYDYLDISIIYNSYGKNKKAENILEAMDITDSTEKTQSVLSKFISEEGEKEKWLIFVDNKKLGERLEKGLGDKRAVFISAANRRGKEKSDTVKEIIDNERVEKQILIATSVLDNGINLKDYQLRNVVLMADTETEFIQMLGRKRADGEKVRLYIYQYDRKHFENRLETVKKRWEIAIDYENYLKVCKESYGLEYDEDKAINHLHIKLMREIANNKIAVEDVKCLFNVYGGVLYLNLLAYQNLKNLKAFYEMVLRKFDENGEDAFTRIQLGWLGIEGEKADTIIEESKLTKEEKCRRKVINKIKDYCNKTLNTKEAIKFKIDLSNELIILVEGTKDQEGYKTVIDSIRKNERPISKDNMEYLSKYCGIPFVVNVKGGEYVFCEKSQSQIQEETN